MFITLGLMGKEVIYRRFNILRNRTLSGRMDNGICGSRCGRFNIDVEGENARILLAVS
jgi:hypothetical protein